MLALIVHKGSPLVFVVTFTVVFVLPAGLTIWWAWQEHKRRV